MQSELETRVFACAAWLPLPVAAPLRAAEVSELEPAARLEHLAHAAEALMQLLGSVVLLDAAAERNPLKLLTGGRAHAAMGLWRSAIEQLAPGLREPSLPELRPLLRSKTDGRRFLAALSALTALCATASRTPFGASPPRRPTSRSRRSSRRCMAAWSTCHF